MDRYTHSSKRLHGVALERIGQFINWTLDKGLTFQPKNTFEVDCYVDADFAEL